MSIPVAILAGGRATRLLPATDRTPKCLVDVAGRPFAVHQIEMLRRQGLKNIVFLVGHLGEMVRDCLGDGRRWGVRLEYVFDGSTPLGTGGSIRRALRHLGDTFFVLYGDSYLECNYATIAHTFAESGKSALMTVCRNDDRWDRSNVQFANGRIVSYHKKRRTSEMHHIDYGLGMFRKSAFEGRQDGDAFDLATVYQQLLGKDDLAGFEVPGRFYEIGSPAGLEETRAYLSQKGTPDDELRKTAS
jgi:MurNAc alpha-1-phosphate uridylyltransferase